MKLFDKVSDDSEEVRLRTEDSSGSSGEDSGSRLQSDVESSLMDEESSSTESSSSSSSSSLPGMGSGTDTSTGSSISSSSSVDLKDIQEQNERIIGLLEDIKSEVGGGSSSGVL